MGEWDDFFESWRVFRLLQSLGEPMGSDPSESERRRTPRDAGAVLNVDFLTGYLGRELLDAVRVHAIALGIVIDSAYADVTVVPLPQASTEVVADRPWIRYTLTVDADVTGEALSQLHRQVQTTCVHRLESEYDTPIAGNMVNTRATESSDR